MQIFCATFLSFVSLNSPTPLAMSSRRSIIIFLLVIFSLNLRVAPVDDLTCKNNSTAAQKTKCVIRKFFDYLIIPLFRY